MKRKKLLNTLLLCKGQLQYAIDFECHETYEKVQYQLEAIGYGPEIWVAHGGKLSKLIDTQIDHITDKIVESHVSDMILKGI